MTDLTYFAQYGKMTNPGPYANFYASLPSDLAVLVSVVQGLMVHVFWAKGYGLKLDEERQAEVQLRSMERRLARMLELLPWDCWGMILMDYDSLPLDDLSLLDRLADLTYGDVPDVDMVHRL